MPIFKAAALAAASALFLPTSAIAASVILTPTADGDVQTFGGDDVDTTDTVVSFTQSGGLVRNSILEYDLSSIANGSTIDSASLEITLTRFVSGGPNTFDVFGYNGDGTVNIADFDAAGTLVIDSTIANGGAAGDTRSFNLTNLAPLTAALVGDMLTLRIETDSFLSSNFASLENTTYDAAQLTINYTAPAAVPVPATLPLLATGMAGFVALKRRRKS